MTVPDTVTAVWLAALIGSGLISTDGVPGGTVSLTAVSLPWLPVFPAASVATTVAVIVPSANDETLNVAWSSAAGHRHSSGPGPHRPPGPSLTVMSTFVQPR